MHILIWCIFDFISNISISISLSVYRQQFSFTCKTLTCESHSCFPIYHISRSYSSSSFENLFRIATDAADARKPKEWMNERKKEKKFIMLMDYIILSHFSFVFKRSASNKTQIKSQNARLAYQFRFDAPLTRSCTDTKRKYRNNFCLFFFLFHDVHCLFDSWKYVLRLANEKKKKKTRRELP